MEKQLLADMQLCIESLYEININYNVTDFVTTSSQFAGAIGNHNHTAARKEELFVYQQDDCLDVSLYLDQNLLAGLSEKLPFTDLTFNHLTDFWIVLEGVSHFCYLTWNAAFNRSISRLEMELQAEVDKFICASHIMHKQGKTVDHYSLWASLFTHCRYLDICSSEQLDRYRRASYYAGQYCTGIRKHKQQLNSFKEIRRFYRLRGNEKIKYISSICPAANTG